MFKNKTGKAVGKIMSIVAFLTLIEGTVLSILGQLIDSTPFFITGLAMVAGGFVGFIIGQMIEAEALASIEAAVE